MSYFDDVLAHINACSLMQAEGVESTNSAFTFWNQKAFGDILVRMPSENSEALVLNLLGSEIYLLRTPVWECGKWHVVSRDPSGQNHPWLLSINENGARSLVRRLVGARRDEWLTAFALDLMKTVFDRYRVERGKILVLDEQISTECSRTLSVLHLPGNASAIRVTLSSDGIQFCVETLRNPKGLPLSSHVIETGPKYHDHINQFVFGKAPARVQKAIRSELAVIMDEMLRSFITPN